MRIVAANMRPKGKSEKAAHKYAAHRRYVRRTLVLVAGFELGAEGGGLGFEEFGLVTEHVV